MLAYYMFVNHGWRPKLVDDMTLREKILMLEMAKKEVASRKKAEGR